MNFEFDPNYAPAGGNEDIPLEDITDDDVIPDDDTPFDDIDQPGGIAAGGSAETSFSAPVQASDAEGLTLEQQTVASAVDSYYNAWFKEGIVPSLGRDINKFELDAGGRLRLKDHPNINIINTKTSRPNSLNYVAKQVGWVLSKSCWVSRIGSRANKSCHQPRLKTSTELTSSWAGRPRT